MKKSTLINVGIIIAVAGGVVWGLTWLKKKKDKEAAAIATSKV